MMKSVKVIVLFIVYFFTANASFAQYATLVLNYEKSCFGENEPLPARRHFVITGVAATNIPYVEVSIYDSKRKDEELPIYQTFWKRDIGSNSPKFVVPINQKLREGKAYDVAVRYYRVLTSKEQSALLSSITKTLDAYLDDSYKKSETKMDFHKSPEKIKADFSQIVLTYLMPYRQRTDDKFQAFSKIVEMKIDQIEGQSTKHPKSKEAATNTDWQTKLIVQLKELLRSELTAALNVELYTLADDKIIEDYPTEEVQNSLPVNIGYGGAFVNTNADAFNYVTAPYLGLSFPFGKEGSNSKFLQRTSFSLGAVLDKNLQTQDQTTYTGPVFKYPAYAALGYRAFRFMRLNVGATVLENTNDSHIKVSPFVGLSAELNFSLSLAKE